MQRDEIVERTPRNTPLSEWPSGWLKMSIASLLDNPLYIMMHDHEKRAAGLPVSDDEMRALITASQEKKDE